MTNIENFGYTSFFKEQETNNNFPLAIPARVLSVHKERYILLCEHGEISARLKGSIFYQEGMINVYPTTGDFVFIDYNSSGDSQILKTLNRISYFSRRDSTPGRGEQSVSANFDYVFILVSLNMDFNLNRVQRYLTASWQSGGVPVIVLTKSDLVDNYNSQIKALQKIAVGVDIVVVSAVSRMGLDLLDRYLQAGKTIVFLGSSGVGKSSLVNALSNDDIMLVKSIREDDSKGRHTTTHRQLISLPSGAMIIDTPGMRELGMWDVTVGLKETFSDIDELFLSCKFSNCTHQSEPGCAVLNALENGTLDISRWKTYLQLKKEAKFSDDKSAYFRERQQFSKSLSKQFKQHKRSRGK